MKIAPESLLPIILVLLALATTLLLSMDLEIDMAVAGARAVCVVLAILLIGGLIIPWKRRLANRRLKNRPEEAPNED